MIFSLMCDHLLQANLDESEMSSPPFLRALMTSVCKAAVKSKWLSISFKQYQQRTVLGSETHKTNGRAVINPKIVLYQGSLKPPKI